MFCNHHFQRNSCLDFRKVAENQPLCSVINGVLGANSRWISDLTAAAGLRHVSHVEILNEQRSILIMFLLVLRTTPYSPTGEPRNTLMIWELITWEATKEELYLRQIIKMFFFTPCVQNRRTNVMGMASGWLLQIEILDQYIWMFGIPWFFAYLPLANNKDGNLRHVYTWSTSCELSHTMSVASI